MLTRDQLLRPRRRSRKELVRRVLQRAGDIPEEMRADVLELVALAERRSGRPRHRLATKTAAEAMAPAVRVYALERQGWKRGAAVAQVAADLRISKSTVGRSLEYCAPLHRALRRFIKSCQ
jgi:hypothetical protein